MATLGLTATQLGTQAVGGGIFTFQAGATADQSVSVSIADMSFAGLFQGAAAQSNVLSAEQATLSMGNIDNAIDSVNTQRAKIGAAINQMTYGADNLGNLSTNLSASRSSIMDTDYAVETSELAKSQIIQQAATAMLSQANQQASGILTLLKAT